MKVHMKRNFAGYSGTIDEAVYYFHPRLRRSLMRDYVVPKESASNIRMKTTMANLKLLEPSEGYKQNLKDYMNNYNAMPEHHKKPMLTWTNVFLKLMYAMKAANPVIDLTTITREQIITQDLPCQSVKSAVEAGLLPSVEGYEWYDQML